MRIPTVPSVETGGACSVFVTSPRTQVTIVPDFFLSTARRSQRKDAPVRERTSAWSELPARYSLRGRSRFQADLLRGLEQFRFGRNLLLHFLGNDFGAIKQTCFLLVELEVHTNDADRLPAHVEGHNHIVAVLFFLHG